MSTLLVSMPSDLKEENRKAVLYAFHDSGALTANDVSAKTGISRQTVKKCIEYYARNQLLSECGKGSSSQVGGKRPDLFALNDKVRMLSILLHHREISLNLMDLHYNNVASWSSGTVHISGMDMMWDLIRAGAEAIFAQHSRDAVIGICMPMPLATDTNYCLTIATPYPNWPKTDYGRSFSIPLMEMFPQAKNILIASDGRAAGSAILQENAMLRTQGELVTFYSDVGIGGSFFSNGDLKFGANGLIGTFGHIIVAPGDLKTCACGGHGCLESMVSRPRMRERLASASDEYAKSCLAETPVERCTFEQLFKGSAAGDKLCRSEVLYYADMYAIALHNVILTVDPTNVVFQGDFGLADEAFRQRLLDDLHEFKYTENHSRIQIDYDCKDLAEQETIGATYLLIIDYLKHPEHYIE